MRIHLDGLGVMGCLLAVRLSGEGHEITWHDTETNQVSWRASTGAIPIFGDIESWRDWCHWDWALTLGDRWEDFYMRQYMESAAWCYTAENPPHGAARHPIRVAPRHTVGPIKISDRHSWHLNVQKFVRDTRRHFAEGRREWPADADLHIVTHGFGKNIWKWSWGWSAKVRIHCSKALREGLAGLADSYELPNYEIPRGCYYLRKGYQLPYLYPVPNTELYYAGTTLITQQKPKSLPVQPKYDTWKQHVEEWTEGHIRVKARIKGSLQEAWRPMADPEAPLIEQLSPITVRIRPQYGNGIRRFPSTYDALKEVIG